MTRLITILIATTLLAACSTQPTEPDTTLYNRLGGQAGITTIVDNLLFEIGGNETLIGFFADTDIDRFREKLIEQLCEVSDGPCEYTGDSMAQVHADMDIDNRHFDALVTDLITAMTEAGVPTGAQNDLLARLVPMHDEVIHAEEHLNGDER
ncbi:group I truncated hemoglobin [Saccharospirillum salsuginis]|uniref:Group 1 truncated hemoglobin n=1 Tax=Saccharospirillum salsuginis TaxID=418750 RepID=A0A918KLG9_9GAMM|nr:group 1 truncated hemoglobin [Saccharospirillum salsuginis]GGX67575.1 group 1 truncated hemoglobin [Saccharospirillum salsuginis]